MIQSILDLTFTGWVAPYPKYLKYDTEYTRPYFHIPNMIQSILDIPNIRYIRLLDMPNMIQSVVDLTFI